MADPTIGDDFLSNPTSQPLEYKETAPGQAIPPGLSAANVPQADDFNAIRNALNALRTYALTPLTELAVPFENLLTNTQWQLMTNVGYGNKYKADGTGTMTAIAVSSYTTNTNTPVCTTTNTQDLKIGDLVLFDASASANMKICPSRVNVIVANTSFTCGLPRGLSGLSSASCNAQPVDAGGSGSAVGTDGPDGWTKPTGPEVWREDNAVNLYPGSRYSCGYKKSSADRQDLTYSIPAKDIEKFLGKTIVFGVGVKHGIKGGTGTWRAVISVDGGDTFSTVADSASFQWREITATVPLTALAISVAIAFEGNSGDVYYVSQPMAGVGNYLGAWNYSQPKGEILQAVKSIELTPYVASSLTFPLTSTSLSDNDVTLGGNVGTDFSVRVRVNAETYGAVAATIREAKVQMRARSAALTYARSNAFTTIRVACTTGGVRGTAAFRISANSGVNWSTIQVSSGGVGTMSWPAGTYSGDVNNPNVKYQVINVGNGGSYTLGDYWDFTTAGVKTFTGAGYDGITITTVTQKATWGLRDRNSTPAPAQAQFYEASVVGALESQTTWVQFETNGDFFAFAGTQALPLTEVTLSLNGYITS